jgi:CspA family cold shock protein
LARPRRQLARASGVRLSYPSPSAAQASEPVEAIVIRFNAEKGFGFVAVMGRSDAFLHIRQLEAAGHSSLPAGAHIKVRIGQGQKGAALLRGALRRGANATPLKRGLPN